MDGIKTLAQSFRKYRSKWWRLQRILFMSPAEVRFIELMGGKTLTLKWPISKQTGFPFTLVLSLGTILKPENFKREIRYGRYFVDFANDLDRIIEIDGAKYHMDVVADMDREIYIKELCRKRGSVAKIMRIPAYRIYNSPARVQADVLKFINE